MVKANKNEILELDEAWSFVGSKRNQRWIWASMCKRTKQIVGFYVGGREEKDCWLLRNNIREDYLEFRSYSDLYPTYDMVFDQNLRVDKKTGLTNHMERWWATLRNRLGRLSRKTLSFSKSEFYLNANLKLFIYE